MCTEGYLWNFRFNALREKYEVVTAVSLLALSRAHKLTNDDAAATSSIPTTTSRGER